MGRQALTFGVLGALEVCRDGTPVTLASARQRAVLAALLVRLGRPVAADSLIDAAWGDRPPEAPRAALHTVVSRLRHTLGPEVIRSEPGGYRLTVAQEALDVVRFEDLLARTTGVPTELALARLNTAAALCRGPAYAEFADRDFARPEAVRLEELRLTTIEERAALCLEIGDTGAAIATLEAFIADHPLRERARGLLMSALYHAGRVSEALEHYTAYRHDLLEELGLDPSPALRDLHRRLLDHDPPPTPAGSPPTPPAELWPAPDDAFVGREDEVAALVDLAGRHRAVTITGVGGVGKTRLLAETLPVVASQLRLTATVVELAGVPGDQVQQRLASRLGLGPVLGDVCETVVEYLSVTPLLLVLDGCEHAVPAVRSLVGTLLRRCSRVRVLSTSRRRIGLASEQVLPLRTLAVPFPDVTPAEARLSAALRLFADRARRISPSFGLTEPSTAAAAEICRRLDGLPLGIELAATRAATLGVEAVRDRIDQSLDLLDGDTTGSTERSLRAVLRFSYDLLAPSERSLFAALAVFSEPFDVAAAEQVAAGLDVAPVAGVLAALVDSSLVVTVDDGPALRFRQLQIVRTFAEERLAERGDEGPVRLAHAEWVRTVVWSAVRAVEGPGGTAAAAGVTAHAASIRAAMLWALETAQPRMAGEIAGGLVLSSEHRHLPPELADVVRQVAEEPAVSTTPAASLALGAKAFVAVAEGDLPAAERAAEEALPAARTPDEHFLALAVQGVVTLYRGDLERSRRWWGELLEVEGLPLARQAGAHASLALVACFQGDLAHADRHARSATSAAEAAKADAYSMFARYAAAEVAAAHDPATAVPLLVEVIRDADRVGADFAGGLAATALTAAFTRLGRSAEALGVLGPLLDRWLRLARWPQLWTSIRVLARLLAGHGRPETAALLLAAADHAVSAPSLMGDDSVEDRELTRALRERIGKPVDERIRALAEVLPRSEVVDRARAAVAVVLAESAGLRSGDTGPVGHR